MCLDAKDPRPVSAAGFPIMPTEEVTAWKAFYSGPAAKECNRKGLYTSVMGFYVPPDTWKQASGEHLFSGRINYPGGFHACPTRYGAFQYCVAMQMDSYTICKVTLRGVHTTGYQFGVPTYVASEIYLSQESIDQRTERREVYDVPDAN